MSSNQPKSTNAPWIITCLVGVSLPLWLPCLIFARQYLAETIQLPWAYGFILRGLSLGLAYFLYHRLAFIPKLRWLFLVPA